jgi:hypothetical protein
VYLDGADVRNGDIDPAALFAIDDVTEQLPEYENEIAENLILARDIHSAAEEPPIDISEQCNKPYSCAFDEYCKRHLPKPNVFDLYGTGFNENKKFECYRKGIVSYADIRNAGIKLGEVQSKQIAFELDNLPPFVDAPAIRDFLGQIRQPVYFLDFETYMSAVPLYDGYSPYQSHVPFQYSLHVLNGDTLEHKEFLADERIDEYRAIAERLVQDIPADNGTVVSYYKSFEETCIKRMAETFPDLSERLLDINKRMKDLRDVFSKGMMYKKEIGRSFSIKSILPALFPGDPDLDYLTKDVQVGMGAIEGFLALRKAKSQEEREKIRTALREYCELDTRAMVEIYKKLWKMCSE